MNSEKSFSVREAADMLGVSEITIRRRIQDGQLEAVMDSKKKGYRITENSLRRHAESQESRVGSIWKGALIGVGATLSFLKFSPTNLLTGALIGGVLGKFIETIVEPNERPSEVKTLSADHIDDLEELKDPHVIDKVIERLNIEVENCDLQIEYQESKLRQTSTEVDKLQIQEELFQVKTHKLNICRNIKNLEIRRALLENSIS